MRRLWNDLSHAGVLERFVVRSVFGTICPRQLSYELRCVVPINFRHCVCVCYVRSLA